MFTAGYTPGDTSFTAEVYYLSCLGGDVMRFSWSAVIRSYFFSCEIFDQLAEFDSILKVS